MMQSRPLTALPETLQDLFDTWLARPRHAGTPRPDGSPELNRHRSPSDLANHERALKDFALGQGLGADLQAAPLTLLALEEERILVAVVRGASQRRGQAPSKHLESSLRSWMRRLLSDMADVCQHKTLRPMPGHTLWKPYRNTLPRFSMSNWPLRLQEEFDALEEAYADPYYVGPGHEYLKAHEVRPITWQNYRRAVNKIVEYMLTVEGCAQPTLAALVHYERVLRVRSWYLRRKDGGGFGSCYLMFMAVAAIARYLEITGQLQSGYAPFSKDPLAPWMRFFALSRSTLRSGHKQGKVQRLPELPPLSPKEMEVMAQELANTPARRVNGRASAYQLHRRRTAATFYGLAPVIPVRIKNWVNMQWNHNLYQDDKGHWQVYFRPEELKNGTRGRVPREYRVRLPLSVARWVEWWRTHLTETIGVNFQQVCPYVFPGRQRTVDTDGAPLWTQVREDSFRRLIRDHCLEVRGHAYRPHAIRSDVTEYLLGRPGASMRSVQQAAMLLGDSEATVLKAYNKPDVQAMLDEDYFSEL